MNDVAFVDPPLAPTDTPWGERVAHVADPDGNLVMLTREA